MATLEKSQVAKEIMNKLKEKAVDGEVKIHTKEVHYNLLPYGAGSCSVDRYLRQMRSLGWIDYIDPRRTNYYYIIKIKR